MSLPLYIGVCEWPHPLLIKFTFLQMDSELTLQDRVAFACTYLNDKNVSFFAFSRHMIVM